MFQYTFKGIVSPKMNILSLVTHADVILNCKRDIPSPKMT